MLKKYKKEFFNCVKNNQLDNLNCFLQEHNKAEEKEELLKLLNSKNEDGETALYIATYQDNIEIVKALISAGANPDEYSSYANSIIDIYVGMTNNKLYKVKNAALWKASHDGNEQIVSCLIASGADKYLPRVPDNSPPVFAAAFKGHQAVVKLFIQTGIDVNFRISESETDGLHDANILSVAIGNKHNELAKYLIQQGVFVHYSTEHVTNLPLHYAITTSQTKTVELLLDEGAGIGGNIPYLPRGINFKNRIVIGLKINHESVNRNSYDSLQNAITSMDELIEAKKRQNPIPFIRNINLQDALGNTKLHKAILSGHQQIMPVLFECGIDVNITNNQGHTALRLLLDQEKIDYEVAKSLIKHGADPNTRNKGGKTLLHLLATTIAKDKTKSTLSFDELIALGADPNIKDSDEKTYSAIYEGSLVDTNKNNNNLVTEEIFISAHEELFKIISANKPELLIRFLRNFSEQEQKKLVNSKNKDKKTPLYIASSKGFNKIVSILIENSAKIDKTSCDEKITPLWIAALGGHYSVVKTLLENHADINKPRLTDDTPPIFAATASGHLPTIKLLVRYGANIHYYSKDPKNAINLSLIAAKGNYLDVLNYLQTHNINVNFANQSGKTALYIAAQNGFTQIVTSLLDNKAKVDLVATENNDTPLCAATFHGHTEVVRLLVRAGARVNHGINIDENITNATPAWIAADEGHDDILRILINGGANIHTITSSQISILCAASHSNFKSTALTERKKRIIKNQPIVTQTLLDLGAGLCTHISRIPAGVDFTHRLAIGLSVYELSGYETVTREHKGFAEAITSVQELKDAIWQGIDIPRKIWIDSCLQKLEIEPNNEVAKEVMAVLYNYFPVNIINNKDANGETSLHFAVRYNPKIIPELLEHYADPTITNNNGDTPLRLLLDQDNFDKNKINLAISLVLSGAKVDTQNKNGDTLCHLIAHIFPEQLLSYMSKLGVKPDICNNFGETSMEIAEKILENTKPIAHYSAPPMQIISLPATTQKLESKNLYTLFFNSSAPDEKNKVYLPKTSLSKNVDNPLRKLLDQKTFKFEDAIALIKKGYSINTRNKEGKTLLHLLAPFWLEKADQIFQLISLNADQTIEDYAGKTWIDIKTDSFKKHNSSAENENSATVPTEEKISNVKEMSFFSAASKEEIIEDIEQQSVVFASITNCDL